MNHTEKREKKNKKQKNCSNKKPQLFESENKLRSLANFISERFKQGKEKQNQENRIDDFLLENLEH